MASSSLTTPTSLLSSSAPLSCWKYDVFLSFRGPDTRKSFTSELYVRLQNRGIKTFMDEEDLQVGDEISPTLLAAIAESRFAIIVLSKGYASSTWCLEEVTNICQCMIDKNRILPIFYEVEPGDVRNLKGSLEEAFTNHENSGRYGSDKVQQWRDALNKVASFTGWNTKAYKTYRQLYEDVVEFMCIKVQPIEINTGDFEAEKQDLELKLLSANLLVDDAEEKQIRKPEVKEWLVRLKDTLYHARDLLDEINIEALRLKLEGDGSVSNSSSTSIHQVRNLNSTSFNGFETAIKPKMAGILKKLTLIMKQKDALGLKVGTKNWPKSRTRETTSLLDDSGIFGRDQDKETIKKLLLSDEATGKKIGVIPIVGMGGIGKTTLAQLLYNDVKQEFDLQAWVCVSDEFDLLKVTQAIYGSITKKTCDIMQLDLLQVELKDYLENKRFLLVLDDVWNENYNDWDKLKGPFTSGANGSKIIVTTRNKDVASIMHTLPSYNLKQISEVDCWLLFAKHAFGSNANVVITQNPDLVNIGRQIAMKCKGVPLSAKSLGGLLRSEVSKEKWERILKSDLWHLSEKGIDFLPALWISYRHLPSHLKRCFAYCSIFPKGFHFEKTELVRMWMAEDLLQPEKMKMMEEVGEDYFDALISRSFFQPSQSGRGFEMHDIISDLAKYVSGDFCLRLEDEDLLVDVSKTRHFSLMKGSDESEKLEALYEAKSLHTFTSFTMRPKPNSFEALYKARSLHTFNLGMRRKYGNMPSKFEMPKVLYGLLPTWQCLRLLNLSWYDVRELPISIGNLKHLRHLDLSSTSIEELPDTLCTLYNMQTLLLRGCSRLFQLPKNLGRLVNLRHLDIRVTNIQKLPPHMGELKELQFLDYFEVGKDAGCSIAELKQLHHLGGTLCILRLENVVSDKDALEANMRGKKNLNELVLEWSDSVTESLENVTQVLDQLQPHTNLKKLKIVSYGGLKFPNWVGDISFSNLVFVELQYCRFCFSLPPLGQLPSLEGLRMKRLNGVVSIGSEFYGNNTGGVQMFRSLKYMIIEDMWEWQEWVYVGPDQEKECAIFPNLSRLDLYNCPKLTNTFPLDKFPKLEEVRLSNLMSFIGPLSLESECPKFLFLTQLDITNCPEFVCFPDGGIDAPKLKTLSIEDCVKFVSLPERMNTLLPSLMDLEIEDCPGLQSFPEGGLPLSLEELYIRNTKLLSNRNQWGLHAVKSLGKFSIEGEDEEANIGSSFPEEGLLPATLTFLELHSLPNLRTIDGKELRNLNSLQKLWIRNCPKLECFPEEGLPTSLSELAIWGCPLLEERCERGNGQDWPKIAHIPSIMLNYYYI